MSTETGNPLVVPMSFETLRGRFVEADKYITIEQFRALKDVELEALIHEANLTRAERGQARIFHAAVQTGRTCIIWTVIL